MKKQVLSALALCTCLGVAQAQTDVTSQYLVNPSFEENVSYTADAQATNIETGGKIQNDYADNGWTRTSAIQDWGISTTMAYGTAVTLDSKSIPATAPEENGTAGLAMMASWGGAITYQQDAKSELPAGCYKLQCNVYNAGSGDVLQASNFGFVTDSKSYLSPKSSFTKATWSTEEITFYLPEQTSGKIQIGITTRNAGAAEQPLLIYDNVKLYTLTPSLEEPADLTLNVGTDKDSWNGSGTTTVGGISVVERYNENHFTGNALKQTVSGLLSGIYKMELYANASCADWNCTPVADEGSTECTYVSVNGEKKGIPVYTRRGISSPDIITFYGIEVSEDGTLTISIDNEKQGANWIITQIKSLTYQGTTDKITALEYEVEPRIAKAKKYVIDCPKGVAAIVNTAISQGEGAVSGNDANEMNVAIVSLDNAIELAEATIPVAEDLEALIVTCENTSEHSYAASNVATTFQTAIKDAQQVLNESTKKDEFSNATLSLEKARQEYLLNAKPKIDHSLDYSFLIDGACDSKDEWTKTYKTVLENAQDNYGIQNNTNKNNGELTSNSYLETWTPDSKDGQANMYGTGQLYYTAKNLPAGHYRISAYTFDDTKSGVVNFFVNDQKVQIDATTNLFSLSVIDDIAINSDTETKIGLEITEAGKTHWVGITHIKLEYLSALESEVSLNITEAGWATLILPFEAEVPENVTAYTCDAVGEVENGVATLTLTEADKLEANTPYILQGTEGKYEFQGKSVAAEDSYTEGLLTGTLVEMTAEEGTYVLQNQTKGVGFYKVGSDAASQPTVGANRVYLKAEAAAAGSNVQAFILKSIDGDGTTTGIDSTLAEEDATVNVYNLNGILVRENVKMNEALNGLQKGIYIVNGTKKAVK